MLKASPYGAAGMWTPMKRGHVAPLDGTPLLGAPGVLHYQASPVALRHYENEQDGRRWTAYYGASHDGAGWLVSHGYARLMLMEPGDCILARHEVVENLGTSVKIRSKSGHAEWFTSYISPDSIVLVEERRDVKRPWLVLEGEESRIMGSGSV